MDRARSQSPSVPGWRLPLDDEEWSCMARDFQLSRRQRKCGTALSESDRQEIQAIFSQVPKGDALQRLRCHAA